MDYLNILTQKIFTIIWFKEKFYFLSSLYLKDKLPKVLMLSGSKGVGKSTLINHLLFSIFDERNYNKTKYTIRLQVYIKSLRVVFSKYFTSERV